MCVGVTEPSMVVAAVVLLAALLHRWEDRGTLASLAGLIATLAAVAVLVIAMAGVKESTEGGPPPVCTSVIWL